VHWAVTSTTTRHTLFPSPPRISALPRARLAQLLWSMATIRTFLFSKTRTQFA